MGQGLDPGPWARAWARRQFWARARLRGPHMYPYYVFICVHVYPYVSVVVVAHSEDGTVDDNSAQRLNSQDRQTRAQAETHTKLDVDAHGRERDEKTP